MSYLCLVFWRTAYLILIAIDIEGSFLTTHHLAFLWHVIKTVFPAFIYIGVTQFQEVPYWKAVITFLQSLAGSTERLVSGSADWHNPATCGQACGLGRSKCISHSNFQVMLTVHGEVMSNGHFHFGRKSRRLCLHQTFAHWRSNSVTWRRIFSSRYQIQGSPLRLTRLHIAGLPHMCWHSR